MPQHVIPLLEIRSLDPQQLMEKYGRDLMIESKTYYEQLLEQQTQVQALPQSEPDRYFDTERVSGSEFEMADFGKAFRNIPASAENLVRGVGELIDQSDEIGAAFVDKPWETLTALGKGIIEPFTSKEKFRKFAVEDPVGLATTFAPGTGQLAKASILPRALRQGLKLATPSRVATGLARRGGRAVEEVGEAAAAGLQISTGLPEEAIKGAFRSSMQSPGLSGRGAIRSSQKGRIPEGAAGRAFAEALEMEAGGRFDDVDMIRVTTEAVKGEWDRIKLDIKTSRKAAKLEDYGAITILNDVERKLNGILEEFDITFKFTQKTVGIEPGFTLIPKKGPQKTFPSRPIVETQPTFAGKPGEFRLGPEDVDQLSNHLGKNFFNEIMPKGTDPTRLKRITAKELNAARERLDSGFLALSKKNQAIVGQFKQEVNRMVDRLVPEGNPWPGARQRFADESSFLGQVGKGLGVDTPPDRQTLAVLRNLNSIFNQSNTAKLSMADRMEEMTGIPFQALLAGRSMAPLIPKGLVGRQAFIGALAIGGAAGAMVAPATLFFTLPSLAIFSPRVAGNFLSAAGVAAKPVRDSIKVINWLKSKPGVSELVGEGINMSVLIGRVMDQHEREGRESFFRPLRSQN
jgi:hypothetical protein